MLIFSSYWSINAFIKLNGQQHPFMYQEFLGKQQESMTEDAGCFFVLVSITIKNLNVYGLIVDLFSIPNVLSDFKCIDSYLSL